jgi:hypothetical protein
VIERIKEIVMETLDASSAEEKADYGVIKEKIRTDLKRYIYAGDTGDRSAMTSRRRRMSWLTRCTKTLMASL